MELFLPEVGLIFWMFIPFLVVFILLAKFAWPAILKGVDKRGQFIDDSIQTAKEANERLAGIKEEGEKILSEARAEQLRILGEAGKLRDSIINEAKQQAKDEAGIMLEKAKSDISKAKDDAISEIRSEVATLSVEIAEKVVRGQLQKKDEQIDMINRLLDEINISKS